MTLFLIFASCKSPDKLVGDSNVFIDTQDTPTNAGGLSPNDLNNGTVALGASNLFQGVISSPVTGDGFFISSEEGGENSAVFVSNEMDERSGFDDLQMGHLIQVYGEYAEAPIFNGSLPVTTILFTDEQEILVLSENLVSIEPTLITESELSSNPEAFEGVLVMFNNPVCSFNQTWSLGEGIDLEPFYLNSLTDQGLINGLRLDRLAGLYMPLGESEIESVIAPRVADDISFAPSSSEIIPNALTISEVMLEYVIDGALALGGGADQYIELHMNDGTLEHDIYALDGATIQLENGELATIDAPLATIAVGEYATISLGLEEYSQLDIPGLYYLNEDLSSVASSTTISLWGNEMVDSAPIPTNVEMGYSTQLDAGKMNASDNDDPSNWCLCDGSSVYGAENHGTPTAENNYCQ
jgi:hypothetical protein